MKRKVAIQGIRGAYHEIAARKYFKEQLGEKEIDLLPCLFFEEVIDSVSKDSKVIGLIAIENTIAGSLLQNHELIRKSDLLIIGEQKLRISHVLASLPCDSLESITEVNSHPIALMQCGDFLKNFPKMKIIESEDTAFSAKQIADNKLKGHAAICSKFAADLYGLKLLAEGIETNKHNFTRFLLISNQFSEIKLISENVNKASFVFTLLHAEGNLSKVLTIFSFYGINLTRIQSLPIIGYEWEYLFYIDAIFDDIVKYKQGIDVVRPLIKGFKILGEYKENNMVE